MMLIMFLDWVEPASTRAKPACMKKTRKAVSKQPHRIGNNTHFCNRRIDLLRKGCSGCADQQTGKRANAEHQFCSSPDHAVPSFYVRIVPGITMFNRNA
jgi:hypothetical protein